MTSVIKHLTRKITEYDAVTTAKTIPLYTIRGLHATSMSCPFCGNIVYKNMRTSRHRCISCRILFREDMIEKMISKQLLRERWLRLQL